ncbi:hypothetical protein LRS03_07560 [Rhizobacter sp. J219]|uniref:oxygen-dependent tRNA uridine(34) hydroxylase TrhO n=1 Tax=Rhizobacter sp. J219 TaxID=2898430 RepID=UPI0021507E83|nr:rhodanese-like domain-containing protein [Rhizobacter sp. J219]MCR5882717.1 hypothetical protein [Rhizobacter sp. J219]
MPTVHSSFYKFVALDDPAAVAAGLRALGNGLLGSVLVAHEGLNGVLAGPDEALDAFERELTLDPRFAGMAFKRSACRTPPFARLAIHVKPEVVAVGVPYAPAVGTQRTPQEWRELIARDDVVVLDNRNSFEYRLGHFAGAVDPGVANFRDFPRYVAEHAAEWKAAGKEVAMYCTGGIRCEKTAAWMQGLGLTVHELRRRHPPILPGHARRRARLAGRVFRVRQPHRARYPPAADRHHGRRGLCRRARW